MKTTILKQITAGILLLFSTILSAQYPGSLDTSFNDQTGFNELVSAMAVQPDGKILVGGGFTKYNDTIQNRVTRLNVNGGIDVSFNTGTGFPGGIIEAIALQADGKILVGGNFTSYNGTIQNNLIRLNADGSLDTSFAVGTGFDSSVLDIVWQPDGKILVGGFFIDYNGTTQNRIARLNTDGSIDASFNTGTGFAGTFVETIVLQPDGKILAGGNFTSYNGTTRNNLVRLNADGSLDTSFNIGTGFDSTIDYVYAIALQSDGKVLAGGMFTSYNGTTQNRIARLNVNGTLDTSFNTGTGFNSSYVETIMVQTNGKILVGGQFTSFNGTTRNNMASLNADGSFDFAFNIGTGFDATVETICLQPDGKILAGGWFTEYNTTPRNGIVRLDNYEHCPSGYVELLSQADVDAFGANYPNCTHIDGNLYIGSIQVPNSDITDLTPLSNLETVGGGIYIWYNPQLTSLSGLDNMLYAWSIVISNNPLLTDIAPLQGMDLANLANLEITDNPLLGFCHLANICNYLQGWNPRDIQGNSGNCIDEPAVINACGNMSVSDLQSSVVSIYPNPVADVLHIQTPDDVKEIRLLSVTGQLLKSLQRQNSIDLSAYNSGIYFLHVTTENGTTVQKLMKK